MDRLAIRALKRALIDPLERRISSMVARAVIQIVADSGDLQRVQIGVLSGEVIDDAERFQGYGFTSVPLSGAEAVVLFPGGDRAHPLVIATDDRRHRVAGLSDGDACVYSSSGAQVIVRADGDIEVIPGGGGEVRIGSASAADPVARKSDIDALVSVFNGHIHTTTATVGAGATPGVISPPTTSQSAISGAAEVKVP